MSFTPLDPDAEDTQYTITVPKEMTPYLRDYFYPTKKKENETIEQYIVRVLGDYGIQVFLDEQIKQIKTNAQQAEQDELTTVTNTAQTIKGLF